MSHAAAARWSQVGGEGQAAEGTALPSHPTAWGCATEIRLLRETASPTLGTRRWAASFFSASPLCLGSVQEVYLSSTARQGGAE